MHVGFTLRLAFFCAFLLAGFPRLAAFAGPAATAPHLWREIEYPSVPVPNTPGELMSFKVSSGAVGRGFPFNPGMAELCFALTYGALQGHPIPAAIAKPGKFTVRMHLPDGTVVAPKKKDRPDWLGVTGGPGASYSQEYAFPWTRNALDEAWIEVRLPGQTYWVEIPYGFTRNLFAPLEPETARRGPPLPAAAMKSLPAADRIVPWTSVVYDLEDAHHLPLLTAEIGNPYDPQAEISLGSSDQRHGLPPGTAHTEMRMGNHRLGGVEGRHVNMHWTDGGTHQRTDAFLFNSNPPEDTEERGWGNATVTIDGQLTEFVVPSSLFCTDHGHAVLSKDQTIRPPRDPIFQ